MKRILFVVLFMTNCTDVTSPVKNQQSSSSKEAVILTYSQSARDWVQTSSAHCHIASIDPMIGCPYSCDSFKSERMKKFTQNEMDKEPVVLLSNIGFTYTTPINDDLGGGTYQHAISKFPFVYTATQYNGKDSARLTIDSINGSSKVFLRVRDKPFMLSRGESLVLADTVYGDEPPCQRRIIITKILKNEGLDSLPNEKYRPYF